MTDTKPAWAHGVSRVGTRCHVRMPTQHVRARVGGGDVDPRCVDCGGVLKLGTVLFGERLDPMVMAQAVAIVSASPLILAVGSSLRVEPAASLCRVAVERGAKLVIVNRDETPYDGLASQVVRTDIGDALPAIVDTLVQHTSVSARNP